MLRYFASQLILVAIALLAVWVTTGDLTLVWITGLLVVLEVSLSIDNAVINARVLSKMSPVWQKRFLTWGILIAVFGMRLVFPVVVVSAAGSLSTLEVLRLAFYTPHLYHEALEGCLPVIQAFGGGFLLMVTGEFFLAQSPTKYWIKPIEKVFQAGSKIPGHVLIFMAVVMAIFYSVGYSFSINMAFLAGLLTQYGLHQLTQYLNTKLGTMSPGASSGVVGFIYLEVLDASFSFDGVVGAFALTNYLGIIMLGLGIGALFVRSVTLYLIHHNVLARVQYLEQGVHYAVLALAIILLVKLSYHPPEWIIGGLTAIFIVTSVAHSLLRAPRSTSS